MPNKKSMSLWSLSIRWHVSVAMVERRCRSSPTTRRTSILVLSKWHEHKPTECNINIFPFSLTVCLSFSQIHRCQFGTQRARSKVSAHRGSKEHARNLRLWRICAEIDQRSGPKLFFINFMDAHRSAPHKHKYHIIPMLSAVSRYT